MNDPFLTLQLRKGFFFGFSSEEKIQSTTKTNKRSNKRIFISIPTA